MKHKRGISLIVLVIIIIVMIVLAGAVIITLDNSGIIGKANEAVTNSNLKQVEQLASLAWAEAFLDDNIKTDEQYKEYVENKLIANNIKLENYYIEITASGVKVEGPDTTKPTVTIVSSKDSITRGETITYTLTFNDNKEIGEVNLTTDDIILNGFTATKEIVREGNTTTITLSNVQGEIGEKSITIVAGVVTDKSGNKSEASTTKFELIVSLGELITSAADYGKTVNYVSDNGVTGWKVFYKQTVGEEEYIYLIASEKLAKDKVPTVLEDYGATITEATVILGENNTKIVGNIYWADSPEGITVATDTKDKWLANWSNYSSRPSTKCISYFLDENIWNSFRNTTATYKEYIKGAIGTPTAEMFIESWNAKREATGNTTKYDRKLELVVSGDIGYYMNDVTSGVSTGDKDELTISSSDPLYIWSTDSNSSIWLSSPCARWETILMYVRNNGYLTYHNYHDSRHIGVRPVVCLSADIPATTDANGNFVI